MHIKESEPGIVAVADTPADLALPHRWILSPTNATIRDVRKALDGYDFNLIASAIYQFTWHEFFDWYVEWIKADLFSENAAAREQVRSFAGSLCAMTRAEALEIAESGAVPDDAAHALVSGVEVVAPLKELIDVDAELDKLAHERSKIEQDLLRVSGKLGNENFLRNAPADVIAKEQAKLEELKARLAKNEESKERLGRGR